MNKERQKITLNYEEALQALRRAVALKGEDYVYEGRVGPPSGSRCVNWHDNQPSCIVGHVVTDLLGGVPDRGDSLASSPADLLLPRVGIEATPKATELLCRAQGFQDSESPWGEAVALAEQIAGKYSEEEWRDRYVQ